MKKLPVITVLWLAAALLAACKPAVQADDLSSAALANRQVISLDNKMVATVEDVLLAVDSGSISYITLTLPQDPFSYGTAAFLDASADRTAVPWQLISIDPETGKLHLQAAASVLYEAPGLKANASQLSADWDSEIAAYWQSYAIASH